MSIIALIGMIFLSFAVNIFTTYVYVTRFEYRDKDINMSVLQTHKKINYLFLVLITVLVISVFKICQWLVFGILMELILFFLWNQYEKLCDFIYEQYYSLELSMQEHFLSFVGGILYSDNNSGYLVKIYPIKKVYLIQRVREIGKDDVESLTMPYEK